jgi:prephenate dehydrogenase
MKFDTVAIWGMGLLGGSLGLALRKRGLAGRVIGVGRNPERLAKALDLGTCDETTCDLAEGFAEADLAVLCTPVAVLADALPRLGTMFKEGAIVTDVGSTKRRIVEAAEAAMPPGRRFVGCHPMSGAEVSGVAHAREDLYDGNPCFLTPTPSTDPDAVALLASLWSKIGSRVVVTDPDRHDAVVAAISHAPHLASSALAALAASLGEDENYLAAVVGGGFWDTTRLAKGDLAMWVEICSENRDWIDERLGRLVDLLEEARGLIREGGDIEAWLARGRDARLELDALRSAKSEY